jgi:hypothetical protein
VAHRQLQLDAPTADRQGGRGIGQGLDGLDITDDRRKNKAHGGAPAK